MSCGSGNCACKQAEMEQGEQPTVEAVEAKEEKACCGGACTC
jgi:hypothetical protein